MARAIDAEYVEKFLKNGLMTFPMVKKPLQSRHA